MKTKKAQGLPLSVIIILILLIIVLAVVGIWFFGRMFVASGQMSNISDIGANLTGRINLTGLFGR